MPKSTKKKAPFPLWKHGGSGRWAKKVGQQFFYFGRVEDDPDGQAALEEWNRVKDDLLSGRGGRPEPDGNGQAVTVISLANKWIAWKRDLLQSGEITQRTFDTYAVSGQHLIDSLGKNVLVSGLGPDDFQALRAKMAKSWGCFRLKNEMGVVESIFKYGDKAGLFEHPVRFGPVWKKPSPKVLRKQRATKGQRQFTREELLEVLHHATPNMKAMLLLGVSGGFGNTDVALLPMKALDLKGGWCTYPRPKTGINRRVPLWPEVVKRLRQVLAQRRQPKNPADAPLVFIGKRGESYVGGRRGGRVAQEFRRACQAAGVEGRTFYDARRTFQTIGEEAWDLVAVQSVMGHSPSSGDMSAIYRQRVSDARLLRVSNYVRAWLLGKGGKA